MHVLVKIPKDIEEDDHVHDYDTMGEGGGIVN